MEAMEEMEAMMKMKAHERLERHLRLGLFLEISRGVYVPCTLYLVRRTIYIIGLL